MRISRMNCAAQCGLCVQALVARRTAKSDESTDSQEIGRSRGVRSRRWRHFFSLRSYAPGVGVSTTSTISGEDFGSVYASGVINRGGVSEP